MIKHTDHFHGSDLEKIEHNYGIKKEDIVSFSANVNPLGISNLLKETISEHVTCIETYPDREYTELRKTIGKYCNADPSHIIVGNGSTELISILIELRHPKKAMILGPSYSEYEREVSLGGGTSLYFPLKEKDGFLLDINALEERLTDDVDMLILCNPNNPTSTVIDQKGLRNVLDICKLKDIFVMVDETYIEFTENMDKLEGIPLTDVYRNLFIIRGVSKFFASPGLRLGYAVTGNMDLIHEINTRKHPWSISSIAEIAGRIMFSDTDYIEKTRNLIISERKRVVERLKSMAPLGITCYEPSANFVLCKIDSDNADADTLFDTCIREKMMIRNCSTFPFLDNHFFRICFMNPEDNDRLLDCIERALR